MNITIRQLKENDWRVYKELRLTALQTDPKVFGGNYQDECNKPEEEWRGVLQSPKTAVFAVFDQDMPIGLTGIGYDRQNSDQTYAILWGSWLKPEYRGKGLSNMLYKARIAWAEAQPDINRIYVGHRASNLASKYANQKHGFAYTHTDSKVWHDGVTEDDMRYIRIIKSPWGQFPIETDRLILRPPLVRDAEKLGEAKRETWAQLQQWMAWAKGEGPDLEADKAMLAEHEKKLYGGEDGMLVGFEKDTNCPVIFTGMHRPDWEKRIFEIGYWVRASAQGKGYAQEATRALTAHAFDQLKASKVTISAADGNAASLAVIEKCGFTFTHTAPRSEDQMGQETHWFEITRTSS